MVSAFASKFLKSSYRTLSLLDRPFLSFFQLQQIQSHLIVSGTIADPFAVGKLLAGFVVSTSSDISHASTLFGIIPHRSTYVWNTMIRAFVENNKPVNAIFLSKEMIRDGVLLNNYTFSFVFRACSEICDVSLGLMYHAHVIKLGWDRHDFVQNGLVHCYASCDYIGFARKLLDVSKNPDVITWTAVLNGYLKSGNIEMARELFDQMPTKNAVSWGVMINGHVQYGLFKEALDLFNGMQRAGVQPNHAGIVGVLSACGFLGASDLGRWIHAYVNRNGIVLDTVLATALVDMYAKCGCIEIACHVFEMSCRDVFTYTCLISGLANHDESTRAMEVFKRMENEGVKPNEVTFICVLSACSRMGLVEEGLRIFQSMKEVYAIEPGVQHFGCLVDLLGRAGMLEQAKEVVRNMPTEPDSYVLGALLNACSVHGDINLGEEMAKLLSSRSLDHDGVHVLLSNIYAAVKKWDDVESVRKGMEEKKVKKEPGGSLIEVDGVVFEFVAGDRSHDHIKDIDFVSSSIDTHLKSLGHHECDLYIEHLCGGH